MKSLFKLLFIFSFIGLSAQSVSEYAYVYVPKKFKDFKTSNEYNLNKILTIKLGKKNYKVISDDRESWSTELQQNNCSVLNAEVLNDSNMFKNRIKLNFTDCTGKTVISIPATGDYKEFDKGYQDALVKAIAKVPASANSGKVFPVLREETPANNVQAATQKPAQVVKETEKLAIVEKPVQAVNKAEVYTGRNTVYNKVNLGAGQFIFTSANSSVPFATFRESTKPGVYRVQLENGTQTLGYTEGNKLIIEIPQGDGNYRKEEFTRQ